MRFNWIDLLSIGLVATAGGIQFLRGTKDFSRVFYETIFLIAALVATVKLFIPVHKLTGVSYIVTFAGIFVALAVLGIWLAFLLNRLIGFGTGVFAYIFSLLLGIAGGWVIGHAVLRTLYIAFARRDPAFLMAVHKSWMASQLLYFGAFRELLAMLRVARWLWL